MSDQQSEPLAAGYPHIVIAEGVGSGDATIAGAGIAVWQVVELYCRVGLSVQEIVENWPYLTADQVFSALAYYQDYQADVDRVRDENSYEHWTEQHAPTGV